MDCIFITFLPNIFLVLPHLTQPHAPAAVLYGLPGVGLVQDDEVTLGEGQEGGTLA